MNRHLEHFGRILVLVAALLLPLHVLAETQELQVSGSNDGNVAQYFLGDRDGIFITVNVWGKVRRPGQYNIPSGTDLMTLLSVAGGPAENAKLNNVRIIRQVNQHEEILDIDIRRYLETGDISLIPEVRPGDTVLVKGSGWAVVQKVVSAVGQVGIVLNAVVLWQRLE